ncbi:MAG: cbb3-type cytochrome oxidase assembly protein CcoS [Cardiobacteriaceae bacterium]|nr:cbb3-type cytochrome oxidase assembly protein CcoS [Cardiobacteriaceae bacterium]
MQILYLLIPISIVLLTAAVFAFRWAIKNHQFDDLESPGMIPLLDDPKEENHSSHHPS